MTLQLDPLFSENLVFPIEKRFQVFGTSAVGETVTVTIGKVQQKVITDSNGHWLVSFQPINPDNGSNQSLIVRTRTESIVIEQVHWGIVVLLTGQSNIEYEIQNDCEYQEQRQQLVNQRVYYYNVPKIEYLDDTGVPMPSGLSTPHWQQLAINNMAELSAVGYWMSQELQRRIPDAVIGVIDCYKGGTSISSWVSEQVIQSNETFVETFLRPYQRATTGKRDADYRLKIAAYQASVKQHNDDLATYQAANPEVSLSDAKDHVGHTPWPPPMTPNSFLRPSGLYHTMIGQITNYSFSQVVWYQGENDAEQPDIYEAMLAQLITSWRDVFDDQSLPFNVIQLPGYADEPELAWAKIRQAQLVVVQKLPYVHLVSAIDVGEKHNIHPTSKRQLGTRLGRILSGQAYADTPMVTAVKYEAQRLVLIVSHAERLILLSGAEMQVKINGRWGSYPVRINNNDEIELMLSVEDEIEAVRYLYNNFTLPVIFNEYRDPLSPFCIKFEKGLN